MEKKTVLGRAKKMTRALGNVATDMKAAGVNKVIEVIQDFNAAIPLTKEAGYAIVGLDVEAGMPPRIIATFQAGEGLTADVVEGVLTAHADNKFATLIIKSLYEAWKFQEKIKVAGLKPRGIAIEVGLVPTVTVKFG